MTPDASAEVTCSPKTADGAGFASAPSSIIAWAPLGRPSKPSSLGWNRSFTVPVSSARYSARISATPIRMATWASWPQACMTPVIWPCHIALALEAKGRSTRSSTGSASMSARSATTGPGLPPLRMPTTPVSPTPVVTS